MQLLGISTLLVERESLTTRRIVMKRIIKHWKSSLQKARFRPVKRVITADDCVRRKIRMVEIQLKADFARESKLFLSEFRKPDCFQSTNCAEYVHEMMNRHLDVLFANCVKNYIHFCVLNYFSSLNLNREATNKSFIRLPIDLEERILLRTMLICMIVTG